MSTTALETPGQTLTAIDLSELTEDLRNYCEEHNITASALIRRLLTEEFHR